MVHLTENYQVYLFFLSLQCRDLSVSLIYHTNRIISHLITRIFCKKRNERVMAKGSLIFSGM